MCTCTGSGPGAPDRNQQIFLFTQTHVYVYVYVQVTSRSHFGVENRRLTGQSLYQPNNRRTKKALKKNPTESIRATSNIPNMEERCRNDKDEDTRDLLKFDVDITTTRVPCPARWYANIVGFETGFNCTGRQGLACFESYDNINTTRRSKITVLYSMVVGPRTTAPSPELSSPVTFAASPRPAPDADSSSSRKQIISTRKHSCTRRVA